MKKEIIDINTNSISNTTYARILIDHFKKLRVLITLTIDYCPLEIQKEIQNLLASHRWEILDLDINSITKIISEYREKYTEMEKIKMKVKRKIINIARNNTALLKRKSNEN